MLHVKVVKSTLDKKFSNKNIQSAASFTTYQIKKDLHSYAPQHSSAHPTSTHMQRLSYHLPSPHFRKLSSKETRPGLSAKRISTGNRWDLRARNKYQDRWREAFIKGGGF
jgi:hypothetical protein